MRSEKTRIQKDNRRHLALRMIILAWDELFRSNNLTRSKITEFAKQYGGKAKLTRKEISNILDMKLKDVIGLK